MSARSGKKLSTFKRITCNLWIILSFIPLVNGMGIIYAGAKTSKRGMIAEGLILEIPWILLFLIFGILNLMGSYPSQDRIMGIIALFVIIAIIFSILLSVLNSPKYERLIEEEKYRKSNSKLVSLGFLIITCIPFLNGIPFIYLGSKHSKAGLKIEGFIYELPWFLFIFASGIIYINANFGTINQLEDLFTFATLSAPLLVETALALQLISIARFIILNYNSDFLSFSFGSSFTEPAGKSAKTRPFKAPEKEPEYSGDVYGRYKTRIENLTKQYDEKEEKVCELIDKRFENSGITYERFMRIIDNSHENFHSQRKIALDIIELSSEDIVLEDKIKQKISFLELIISKIEDLQAEMVINDVENKNSDEELEELMEDMKSLISSVKDYE